MPSQQEHTAKWRAKNKERIRAYHRMWAAANRERKKKYNAKHRAPRYGLSRQDLANLITSQSNKCAICYADFNEVQRHIDHCHKTGKVRGLLCRHCNIALGLMRDDIELLLKMADYVRFHK